MTDPSSTTSSRSESADVSIVLEEAIAKREAAAASAADDLRQEYVVYLEAERERLLAEIDRQALRFEDDLNEVRHQAHLLGALVQEIRSRRGYRMLEAVASLGRRAKAMRRGG